MTSLIFKCSRCHKITTIEEEHSGQRKMKPVWRLCKECDENSKGDDSVSPSQTVNVFNQFGNGNTQIGSFGTFINK